MPRIAVVVISALCVVVAPAWSSVVSPCPLNGRIPDFQAGAACAASVFEFSNFSFSQTAGGGSALPLPDDIFVGMHTQEWDVFVGFGTAPPITWSAAPGQQVDIDLSFRITAPQQVPLSINQFLSWFGPGLIETTLSVTDAGGTAAFTMHDVSFHARVLPGASGAQSFTGVGLEVETPIPEPGTEFLSLCAVIGILPFRRVLLHR